jgi:hypothetical protein
MGIPIDLNILPGKQLTCLSKLAPIVLPYNASRHMASWGQKCYQLVTLLRHSYPYRANRISAGTAATPRAGYPAWPRQRQQHPMKSVTGYPVTA